MFVVVARPTAFFRNRFYRNLRRCQISYCASGGYFTIRGAPGIPFSTGRAKAENAADRLCDHPFLIRMHNADRMAAAEITAAQAEFSFSSKSIPRASHASKKGLSRFRFNENAPYQPVHRPSTPGDCNVDAAWFHNLGLAGSLLCIPVPAGWSRVKD